MYRFRIQKQVLPKGVAADLHRLSGTSLLFSRILAPFLHYPLISFFSFHVFSIRVDPLHLSYTCPIFSQPSRSDSVGNFFDDLIELPFHWIMVSTFSCVIIFVSCTIIKPTGLLPVGPTFKHAWAAAFFHAREEL